MSCRLRCQIGIKRLIFPKRALKMECLKDIIGLWIRLGKDTKMSLGIPTTFSLNYIFWTLSTLLQNIFCFL